MTFYPLLSCIILHIHKCLYIDQADFSFLLQETCLKFLRKKICSFKSILHDASFIKSKYFTLIKKKEVILQQIPNLAVSVMRFSKSFVAEKDFIVVKFGGKIANFCYNLSKINKCVTLVQDC